MALRKPLTLNEALRQLKPEEVLLYNKVRRYLHVGCREKCMKEEEETALLAWLQSIVIDYAEQSIELNYYKTCFRDSKDRNGSLQAIINKLYAEINNLKGEKHDTD